MSGVTTKIREKLNFHDEELWKKFSSRRLKLIESNKLYYKKASDQDEEVKKIALILSSEFSLNHDHIDDVDKLVRAAIQSIRRNRKRSCKNSKNDENSSFIVINEFEKKRKRSSASLNDSNSSTAVSSKCSSPSSATTACNTPSYSSLTSYSLTKPVMTSTNRKEEHFLNDILNIENNNNNTTTNNKNNKSNTPSPRHSASALASPALKSEFEFTYSKKQKFTNNDLSKMAIHNFVQPKTKLFSSITGGLTTNARQPYMGCSFFSSASSLKTNKYLLQYSTASSASVNSANNNLDSSVSATTSFNGNSINNNILSTPSRNNSTTSLLLPPPCCTPTSFTSKRQLLNYFEKLKTCYLSSNFNKQSPIYLLGKTSLPNFINYLLVQMYPAKSNSNTTADNNTSIEYLRLKLNSMDVLLNFLKKLDPGNPDIKAMKNEISIDTLYYLIGSCLIDFKFHEIMELVCDIFMEIVIVDFPMIKGYRIFQIGQKRGGLTTDKKTVELRFKDQSLKFFYNLNNSYPTIVEIMTNCKKAFMINENKNLTLKYNNRIISQDFDLEKIFNNDEFYLVFEINFVVNDSNFINLIDTIEKIENKTNKDNGVKTPLIAPNSNNDQLPSPSAGFRLSSSNNNHPHGQHTLQKSYSLASNSNKFSPSRHSSISPNNSMKTSPIAAASVSNGNGVGSMDNSYDRRKSSSTGSFLLDNPYQISSVQSYDRSTNNSRSNSIIGIPAQQKSSISSLLNNEHAAVGAKLIPAKFERLL